MTDIEGGNQSHGDHNMETQSLDERTNMLELYKAALSNDWKKAERIYKKPRMKYGLIITEREETALHVSALAGHIEFVQNLVAKMSDEEIRIGTKTSREKGSTAFHYAAISGNVKIADAIYRKTKLKNLATSRGNGDNFPIDLAASKGNKEMVRYLYHLTKDEDPNSDLINNEDRRTLLIRLIKADIYDVALQVAKTLLSQSVVPANMEVEALTILAQKPLSSPALMDFINPFSHRQAMEERLMYKKAKELIQCLWDALDERKVSVLIKSSEPNPILEAAKHGNFEFLSILIDSYPDVIFSMDHNSYTIIHHAILNRHVDIFKLIHLSPVKMIATMLTDGEGNNMLHLAAKLAPINRLNIVPGAALQLQRELLWFEEVKKVMEPHEVNRKVTNLTDLHLQEMQGLFEETEMEVTNQPEPNQKMEDTNRQGQIGPGTVEPIRNRNDGRGTVKNLLFKKMKNLMDRHDTLKEYTPQDLFVEEHKELMIQGEKWMRDTSNSCMIVAVLITTITFAAAITVPGGNASNGFPNFSSEILFKAFAIADSISLISSATSLLDFLAILTARYSMDDFRWSLPNKLVIGLFALFVSIVAMMVAFVLSIFIIFKNSTPRFPVAVAAVSCVPILLFIWQHLSLFVDVVSSTYTSYLLFKSRKDPAMLFK